MEVYSSAFLVDNSNLGFVVSDRLKNITIFSYQPQMRDSHGGQRLLPVADINIDHQMNTFWRTRCKLVDPSLNVALGGPLQYKHVNYFGELSHFFAYMYRNNSVKYQNIIKPPEKTNMIPVYWITFSYFLVSLL